jgi:hypothetical protein
MRPGWRTGKRCLPRVVSLRDARRFGTRDAAIVLWLRYIAIPQSSVECNFFLEIGTCHCWYDLNWSLQRKEFAQRLDWDYGDYVR